MDVSQKPLLILIKYSVRIVTYKGNFSEHFFGELILVTFLCVGDYNMKKYFRENL